MASLRLPTWLIGVGVGLAAPLGWAMLADAGGPFTPKATQPNITHPIEYAYADPGFCENCHGNYDNDIEPFNLWSGSMMANAGRDPVFLQGLRVTSIRTAGTNIPMEPQYRTPIPPIPQPQYRLASSQGKSILSACLTTPCRRW